MILDIISVNHSVSSSQWSNCSLLHINLGWSTALVYQWHEVTPEVSCAGNMSSHVDIFWHSLRCQNTSCFKLDSHILTLLGLNMWCSRSFNSWRVMNYPSLFLTMALRPTPCLTQAELQNNTWAGDDLLLNLSTVGSYKNCLYVGMIL